MQVIRSIESIRRAVSKAKSAGQRVGFVPTMGALHEGHLALIRRCRKENNLVVLSIFINPAQFDPGEDFTRYPREQKKDKKLAKAEKVDIIFYPSIKTMYPKGYLTYIDAGKLAEALCGRFRPGHFRGVSTVVGKLLNIVAPDVLYLGQKDAQQVVVIRRMVSDLNFPVAVEVCRTVREPDGLALSSRNRYLSTAQRREAAVIYRALKEAKARARHGERNAHALVRSICSKILSESSGAVEYVACVHADTLAPLTEMEGKIMIAAAVRFHRTRLIDNVIFSVKA
jgi:pantoate--beta-alanine ligase